ncbi:MAG: hypothetical protein RJQ03_09795, partial [Miltoncostaeaceae bacterium]
MSPVAPDTVGYVDATLRDLAPAPWGTAVGADDLAAVAAALGTVGARVLEAMDARCAQVAIEARAESPWDRLRAVLREAGKTPVGIVAGGRTLWGERPLAADVVRRFVLTAHDSGVGRIRGTDPLNDPDALLALAQACVEAGVPFVPTLILGPYPPSVDTRWAEEARALAALPGAVALCVSDGAGHVSPSALAGLVREVGQDTGLPV